MVPGDWIAFFVYIGAACALAAAILGLSAVLGPRRPREEKLDPYECGVPLLASARERFTIHFYLVAILFMLFDIESVFLIPWAVVFRSLADRWTAFWEMLIFVGVLGGGLAYVWRRGLLKW